MTYSLRLGAKWDATTGPVGGTFASFIAPSVVKKFSDTWRGGCQSASFTMALGAAAATPEVVHPALKAGSLVEIFDTGHRVWLGAISAIPTEASDEAEFACEGLSAPFNALATPGTTSIANASTAAVARGWRFLPTANLPGTLSTESETDNQINTLAGLLEEYANRTGAGWGVGPNGRLTTRLPAATPSWLILPDTPAIPTAVDDFVTAVYGRYITALNAQGEATAWNFAVARDFAAEIWLGHPQEKVEDLTSNGMLSITAANAIVAAMLADESRRLTYAASIQLDKTQVTTLGGVPARFSLLQVGDRLTHFGSLVSSADPKVGSAPSWVIGQREVDVEANTVTLSPTSLAPRTDANTRAALAKYTDKALELQ